MSFVFRYFLLLFLVVLPYSSMGQTSFKNSINITASATFGYRLRTPGLKPMQQSLFTKKDLIHYLDSLEKPWWGYRFGVHYQRCFGNHVALNIGFQFSEQGYKIDFAADPLYQLPAYTYHYRYSFVEIPITFLYYIGQKKVRPFLEIEIGVMFLSRAKQFSPQSGIPSNQNTKEFKGLNLSTQIGFGVDIQVSNRFSMLAKIASRIAVLPLEKGVDIIEMRLYDIGLELGAGFQF